MTAINRRNLIATTTAALAARTTTARQATPQASPVIASAGLPCGIKYDTGVDNARNVRTRPAIHRQFYRNELTAIRDELHVNHLDIYGVDPTPLTAALDIAADLGFDISLQARLNFLSSPEMLDLLTTIATEAERVRQQGIPVTLSVGCEYLLFADGLIEGNDFHEKMEVITSGNVDWEHVIGQFSGMLHTLAETARATFGGQVTYADTPDMDFAWEPFDIISIDHYLSAESRDTYVHTIDTLAATGKPVWVSEFGSPAWRGASEAGGMAWDIVEYDANPPQIKPGIERDETEQATAIAETLTLISQSQAERAYLYEFIAPGAPRSIDPAQDWDLTSYGVVAVWDENGEFPYDTTGHWDQKEAFTRLATWNLNSEPKT